MLRTLVRRAATEPYRLPKIPSLTTSSPPFPYTWATNPYTCKRTWPPDFTALSQKHQFRLERRYRRRAKLKWARPTWTKFVKLAQWGSILFVAVYGILFMETGDEGETPFSGIRKWYKDQMGVVSSARDDHSVDDNAPTAAARKG